MGPERHRIIVLEMRRFVKQPGRNQAKLTTKDEDEVGTDIEYDGI